MIEQIGDRLTQTGVRLYFSFRELRATPDLQLFHDQPAMLLMEVEALFGSSRERRLGALYAAVASWVRMKPVMVRKVPSSAAAAMVVIKVASPDRWIRRLSHSLTGFITIAQYRRHDEGREEWLGDLEQDRQERCQLRLSQPFTRTYNTITGCR